MLDGEQLVAEQHVSLDTRQTLNVRISQHTAEDFWRVQVSDSNPDRARRTISTTVGGGDNFMMNLIEEAVSGRQAAWGHLAQWGHTCLTRPALGFRSAHL